MLKIVIYYLQILVYTNKYHFAALCFQEGQDVASLIQQKARKKNQ
jgi:hypothetical protein